jgi:hypothetical protein
MAVEPRPSWAPYMAMWRVEELLRKVTEALSAAGVPYAIVGGNAVAAWVASADPDAVRATKDVDILAQRSDVSEFARVLAAVDLIYAEVLGVHMFIDKQDPSPKRGVHLVMANEFIKPEYSHPAPGIDKVTTTIAEYPVIDLPELIEMKLQSFRPVDQTHIIDMLGVNLISDELVSNLPPDLQERFHQVRRIAENS